MKLTNLGGGAGFVKGGVLGFAGSGKTYTLTRLAIGIRKHFNLSGSIAMFDTEAAAQYVAPMVRRETGADLVGCQSRALRDSIEFLKECQKQGVAVAIVDSVTHLWREVCDSYLKQVNAALEKKGKNPRTRLEFQDWNSIKKVWEEFSNLYLNIPMHVLIAGRAGYEYDFEDREDGSGKDLVKTGIKMKTEGEFGFEPSLLFQMDRVQQDADGKLQKRFTHRCTVLKDRFGVLDGKECDDPDWTFFKPYLDLLTPGAHVAVATDKQTDMGVNEAGDAEFVRERKQRTIFCEEIQGLLTAAFPGQSAEEKKAKATIIFRLFGTYSWTAVEGMESAKLKTGLDALPAAIEEYRKPAQAPASTKEKDGAEQVKEFFGAEKDEKKGKKAEPAAAGKDGK
ncbi:MAG TPA: AAA family ATPase [Salinarimonas sp.]|nr:AAA family ATPase [Salinarimonas sp.]